MNAKRARSELNSGKNVVPMVVGAIIVCVVALAMFTQRDSRLSPRSPGYATAMANAQADPMQAQLAFMATNPVDIGIGASLVEMNRTIAQEQGIRNSSGGYVVSVKAGSPADVAGIKQGDVINRINGR